jgi:type IV pilus assembly protein PilN
MRITLNLASNPHIELGTYIKRLRIWILVLAILALPLFALWRSESTLATSARAEEDQLRSSAATLRAEQARSQAQMREPGNAAVLHESHFLNNMFREKSFSWTAVMMDLETVLPAGVQVMTLEPNVQKDGSVLIRLRVSGPRDKSVQLIRNLEHARRFVAPRLAGETAENAQGTQPQQNQNQLPPVSASSNVSFDILAGYNPLAPATRPEKEEIPSDDKPVASKPAVTKPSVPKPVSSKPVNKPASKPSGDKR